MTDQLARRVRLTAESSPAQLAALLQLAAESDGSASAALQLLRSVQTGLAEHRDRSSAVSRRCKPIRAASRTSSCTSDSARADSGAADAYIAAGDLCRHRGAARAAGSGVAACATSRETVRAACTDSRGADTARGELASSDLERGQRGTRLRRHRVQLFGRQCMGIPSRWGPPTAARAARCLGRCSLDSLCAASNVNRGADAAAGAGAGDVSSLRASTGHPAVVQPRALVPYARTVLSAYSAPRAQRQQHRAAQRAASTANSFRH